MSLPPLAENGAVVYLNGTETFRNNPPAGTISYTGLQPRGDVLWLDPMLPHDFDRLTFTIRYRQAWDVKFDIDHECINVSTPAGSAIKVGYDGRVTEVAPGTTMDIELSDASGG